MSARVTPGPWELVRDPRRGVGIQARAGTPSAVHIAYVQFVGTDLEDGLANANLISASPELLEAAALFTKAAHEVRDLLNGYGFACPSSIAYAAEKARHAIAKAEGRS